MDTQDQSISLACLQLASQYENETAKILAAATEFRAFIDRAGKPETQEDEQ